MNKKHLLSIFLFVLSFCTVLVGCGQVKFKLDFMVDNAVYQTIETVGNEQITMPQDPTKTGYVFEGWYWDNQTFEIPFTANSLLDQPLSSNMKVYAKFVPDTQTYLVRFVTNGGSQLQDMQTNILQTAPTTTKPGYVFEGWYKTEDFSGGKITFPYEITQDTTLYANWTQLPSNSSVVIFKNDNGNVIDQKIVTNGETVTAITAPTKTGYDFLYWEYDGVEFDFSTPITQQIELVAKYQIKQFNVTFYVDGQVFDTKQVSYNNALESIPQVPAKTGYTGAWSITNFDNITQNVDVDAIYTAKKFTITFDYNGATGNNVTQNKQVTFDQPVGELPSPTKTDFNFVGWKYNQITYTNATVYEIDGNITLVAQWEEVFTDDGHSIVSTNSFEMSENTYKFEVDNTEKTLTLDNPIRNSVDAFDFKGKFTVSNMATWRVYSHQSCLPAFEKSDKTVNLSEGDNNFWIIVENLSTFETTKYTISLHRNAMQMLRYFNLGTIISEYTTTIEENIAFTAPQLPQSEIEGHTIVGWTDVAYSNQLFDFSKGVTKRTTFHAVYEGPMEFSEGLDFEASTTYENCLEIVGASKFTGTHLIIPKIYHTHRVAECFLGALKDLTQLEKLTTPFVGQNNDPESYDNTYLGYMFGAPSYSQSASYVPQSLTEVELYDITRVRSYSFAYCENIKTVKLPSSVKELYFYCFENCTGLEQIVSSDSSPLVFEEIICAFENCTNLKQIKVSKNIDASEAFENCPNVEIDYIGTIEEYLTYMDSDYNRLNYRGLLGSYKTFLFNGQPLTAEFTLPEGVEYIPEYAFYNNKTFTKVIVPGTVKQLGDNSFDSCTNLAEVVLCEGVESLGSYRYAFYKCGSITKITLPSTLTEDYYFDLYYEEYLPFDLTQTLHIYYTGTFAQWCQLPYSQFLDYEYLTNDKKLYIGSELIEGEVVIPSSITYVGAAFKGLKDITSVVISEGVEQLDYSFEHCTNITKITLPTTLYASYSAFAFVENFDLYFTGTLRQWCENSAVKIGNTAKDLYINGEKLGTDVVVPEGTKWITEGTFFGQTQIKNLTIPASIKCFEGYKNELTLDNFYYDGTIEDWCGVEKNCSPAYWTSNVYFKDEGTYKKPYNVTLSENVTKIEAFTFDGLSTISKITVPASVTEIGMCAFANTGASVEIAQDIQIEEIPYYCFYNNTGTIPAVPASVKTIESYAFANCTNLKSIELPNGLETIKKDAFKDCTNLHTIVIPNSVTTIQEGAFNGCSDVHSLSTPNVFPGLVSTMFADSEGITVGVGNITTLKITGGYPLQEEGVLENFIGVKELTFEVEVSIDIHRLFNYRNQPAPSTLILIILHNKTITYSMLSGCTSLETVNLKNTNVEIAKGAFRGLPLRQLVMPKMEQYMGYYFGASDYSTSGNYVPATLKTLILNEATSFPAYAFYGCIPLNSITVPATFNSVETNSFPAGHKFNLHYKGTMKKWCEYSFKNRETLLDHVTDLYIDGKYVGATLTIEEGIEEIETDAFYKVSINYLNLPKSLKFIRYNAFKNCIKLKTVTFAEEDSNLVSIYSRAFEGCTALTTIRNLEKSKLVEIQSYVFADCSKLSSIKLPSTLTTISEYAFYWNTALTELILPISVVTIKKNAIVSCENLNVFTESPEQLSGWTSGWISGYKKVYFYQETQPTTTGYWWHYDTDGVTPVIWVQE